MALINYKCGKCGLVAQDFQNQPACPMANQPVAGSGENLKVATQQKVVSTAGGHAWTMDGAMVTS